MCPLKTRRQPPVSTSQIRTSGLAPSPPLSSRDRSGLNKPYISCVATARENTRSKEPFILKFLPPAHLSDRRRTGSWAQTAMPLSPTSRLRGHPLACLCHEEAYVKEVAFSRDDPDVVFGVGIDTVMSWRISTNKTIEMFGPRTDPSTLASLQLRAVHQGGCHCDRAARRNDTQRGSRSPSDAWPSTHRVGSGRARRGTKCT